MSYKNLKILFEEQSLINDISGILNWDMATYMPENSRRQRIKQITKLYDYKKNIFNVIKKNEFFNKVNEFELDKFDKINFELMKNKFDYFNSISVDKLKKKAELSIECEGLWREAKEKSNFNIVKNSFVKLVKLIKEESETLSQIKEKKKYDCLLSKYDRSLDSKQLFKIFNRVEKFIKKKLPLIVNKQKKIEFHDFLNEEDQFNLSKIFMKQLGFDFSRGRIDKSLHPFCGGGTQDVRITTRFTEEDSFSCFDALMHETGHALYEQGLPEKWAHQPIGSAGGMSLHESQSLFVEMQIIKSLPVSQFIQQILKDKLGKDPNVWSSEVIYNIRNSVTPGYIRVDSDEVHYPLHIIHRFNIEYKIIEEDANVEHLPDLWNEEFSKTLGLDVHDDKSGCLQDIHWYGGDFGYFPTYSIGAFIAAQLACKVRTELINYDLNLKEGNFKPIIMWLRENIHNRGNFLKIDELLEESTDEKLNLKYFENHIIDRYIKKEI
jgi:carboxypeptidase Taq